MAMEKQRVLTRGCRASRYVADIREIAKSPSGGQHRGPTPLTQSARLHLFAHIARRRALSPHDVI
jgi:hypothetical protein